MKLLLSLLLISLVAISSVSAVPLECSAQTGTGTLADPYICTACNGGFTLQPAGTCIKNCAKPSFDGLTCDTCVQNYARSVTGRSCQLIINNCDYSVSSATPPVYVSAYDDAGKCFRCGTGFSVSFTGFTCAKTVTGCNVYDDFGNCVQVNYCSGYSLTGGIVQCQGCVNSTYTLSADKMACVPLVQNAQSQDRVGNVIACSSAGPGYKLSASNKTCQQIPDVSCSAADDENLCATCADPTKVRQAARKSDCLNTPSCTLAAAATCFAKIENCTVYKAADGACLGCIPGYTAFPVAAAGNLCYKTVPYCTQYASATGLCSQCAGGALTLSVNGTACVAPVPNCPAGNVNDQGKCITCNNGFAFSKNGLCVPQIPYCVAHDDALNLCLQCDSTTTLSADRKACLRNFASVANCAKYDGNGLCKACNVGKYLTTGGIGGVPSCATPTNFTNPSACLEFDENGRCKACFTDASANVWVFSVTKNSCVKPVTNCKEYNDFGTCNLCNPGFIVFKNTCVAKKNGCQNYATIEPGFTPGDCMGCQPGFFYQSSDKTCYPQIEGCKTYIPEGCTACDATAGLEYVVITGSAPANGKCHKKIPGCATYSYITGRCLTCTDAALTPGNLGVNCFKKITDCAQYAEPVNDPQNPVCLACTGKIPTQNGKACAVAITNCVTYNDNAPTSCSLCDPGFVPSAATSAAASGLTCVAITLDPTLTAASTPSISAPYLDLNGPGQVIYNITNVLYCLTHYIVKSGASDFDLSLTVTPSSGDAFKNTWVNLFPCDSVPVERTLWKWVKYSGSATPSVTASDYRTTGTTTLELGLQVYFDSDYKPAGIKKTTAGTAFATDLPKLLKSTTTTLFPWEVSYDSFTTFTVTIISTLAAAQDSFYKGFSLSPKNNYAWTADDTTPVLGAATAWPATVNYATYTSTAVGLATATPPEKFYITLATTAPTNNWAFRSVQLSGTTVADRGKFGSQVTQTVAVNDDILTIDWVFVAPLTNMNGIFPVLSKKVAGSTVIDSICNSRYPEFSRIPFLFSYDGTGTVVAATGLADPTKLLKISVRIPVFRLVDCGFVASLTATTGVTTLTGRIGYFSYANIDGVFQDLTITLGTQYALRNLQIDNMNSYNWYRLSSTDVAKNMNINSVVRFFSDAGLKNELQGNANPDSRGLLVNSSLIYCKLDLVSSIVDPISQNGDPNLLVYQPLQDVYYVLSVKTYLHKKYDATNYWKTEVPSSNLVKGLNNTANWAIDLRKISSGNYIFSVEFFFSQWKVPGAKRILQSVESEVVSEEASEEEIPFEMQMKSTTKDIILNINGLENLKVGLFALAIALFAIFGF